MRKGKKTCPRSAGRADLHVGGRRVFGCQGDHGEIHRRRQAWHVAHENTKGKIGARTMEPSQSDHDHESTF